MVFLGAGLETSYNRIGNQIVNFYQVDLPGVIEVRKRVLGNAKMRNLYQEICLTLTGLKK